jgi:exodeoxyribonuclease-5
MSDQGLFPAKQEIVSDVDLTDEQLRAIDAFVKWYQNGIKHGFGERPKFKLAGPAGSGKSTLAMYALEAVGLNPWGTEVCKVAYTGKAAMVMQQKGLAGSGTIHSRIYIPVDDVSEQIKEMRTRLLKLRGSLGSVPIGERERVAAEINQLSVDIKTLQERSDDDMQWILNPNGAPANSKLVLCDEASMVGGKIQIDLESYNTPILYLGDGFQLQPIVDDEDNYTSVFFDKSGKNLPVDFALTQIHRQAEGSPIIRYSRALRENRRDEINFMGKMVGDDGSLFIRVPRAQITPEHLARAEQIIVGKNDTRHHINEQVRELLGRESPYPEEGDRVIFLKNNKDHNIVNGMMGTCLGGYYGYSEKSQSFKVETELEDGRQILANMLVPYFQSPGDKEAIYEAPGWSRKANLHADYAYAITGHKSQGSQYESGIALEEPIARTEEDRRRWLYTVYTRFANRVIGAA